MIIYFENNLAVILYKICYTGMSIWALNTVCYNIMSVEKVSLFMNVPNPIITNLAVGKLYILFSFVSIYRNQTNFNSRKWKWKWKKKRIWDFTIEHTHFPFSTYYNWIIQDSIVCKPCTQNCSKYICQLFSYSMYINMNV